MNSTGSYSPPKINPSPTQVNEETKKDSIIKQNTQIYVNIVKSLFK